MSNTGNTPSVEELQAEIDRLNSQLAGGGGNANPAAQAAADVNAQATHGPSVIRKPGDGATVIGAGPDPRGGTVLGHSDGTVTLVNVPAGTDGNPAAPWGSAPEGEYVQFYLTDDGNAYNWVSSDGTAVETVGNPNQARP